MPVSGERRAASGSVAGERCHGRWAVAPAGGGMSFQRFRFSWVSPAMTNEIIEEIEKLAPGAFAPAFALATGSKEAN